MRNTLNNGLLHVAVDSYGAQLREISTSDGTQWLWKGDKRYWADSSPVLFPYVARLYDGGYKYQGRKYEMRIHGFAAQSEFQIEKISSDTVQMVLFDNEDTIAQYPFRFSFSVTYSICGTSLLVSYSVINNDEKIMPFALGGHPGINVPFCKDTAFEDYYLSFSEECTPDRIGFTKERYLSGENMPYSLEGNRTLRLRHSLFDDDAIILQNMAKSISLNCCKSDKKLTVSYPQMPYLGIWHMPCTDAPYVCIEPWTSLPSRQGVVEELTCKSDLIRLNQGEKYDISWSLTVSEG